MLHPTVSGASSGVMLERSQYVAVTQTFVRWRCFATTAAWHQRRRWRYPRSLFRRRTHSREQGPYSSHRGPCYDCLCRSVKTEYEPTLPSCDADTREVRGAQPESKCMRFARFGFWNFKGIVLSARLSLPNRAKKDCPRLPGRRSGLCPRGMESGEVEGERRRRSHGASVAAMNIKRCDLRRRPFVCRLLNWWFH